MVSRYNDKEKESGHFGTDEIALALFTAFIPLPNALNAEAMDMGSQGSSVVRARCEARTPALAPESCVALRQIP